MADTLLSVVKRVLVATGQDSNISALSTNDDSQFIADRINDALLELRSLKPNHLDTSATISIVAGTRTYNVPTGLDVHDIDANSLRIDDSRAFWIDEENLKDLDAEYDTRTGEKVQYIYFTDNKIGVYPILKTGATTQTFKYKHPGVWARLTSGSDVFPYPDPYWVTYCERKAQMDYEVFKGLANPIATQMKVDDMWAICTARSAKDNQLRLVGYRRYSR